MAVMAVAVVIVLVVVIVAIVGVCRKEEIGCQVTVDRLSPLPTKQALPNNLKKCLLDLATGYIRNADVR